MPLEYLSKWAPFRIDALGLVTLIGADDVNRAVGRLVQSRYTKFLPILGAYLIAGNQFTNNAPGYTLYNVSDAIMTTSVTGWFTRWLDSQKLKTGTTVFEWNVLEKRRTMNWDGVIAGAIGVVALAPLIVLSTLMADWWGFANAISMVASVAIRWCLIQENTDGLDQTTVNACYGPSAQHLEERVKLLVTSSEGKMVTIYAPRGLVVRGFTRRISPPRHQLYLWAKRFGWLFFGVHIIALGQSDLVSQLCTVILLVVSTWATVQGLGSNESEIGNHIEIEAMKSFPEGPDRRLWAYVKLWPTETQEQSLIDWGLLPRKSNVAWWNKYQQSKDLWAKQGKLMYTVACQEKI